MNLFITKQGIFIFLDKLSKVNLIEVKKDLTKIKKYFWNRNLKLLLVKDTIQALLCFALLNKITVLFVYDIFIVHSLLTLIIFNEV